MSHIGLVTSLPSVEHSDSVHLVLAAGGLHPETDELGMELVPLLDHLGQLALHARLGVARGGLQQGKRAVTRFRIVPRLLQYRVVTVTIAF